MTDYSTRRCGLHQRRIDDQVQLSSLSYRCTRPIAIPRWATQRRQAESAQWQTKDRSL